MARGDHIFVRRYVNLYKHHGVDLGEGVVVHFAGEPFRKSDATISITTIDGFRRGGRVEIERYANTIDPEETVARALSMVGIKGYSLFGNNCEHFARWCVTGTSGSRQVDAVVAASGVAGVSGFAGASSIGVVSAAGVTSGLSGPGIMSGLAWLGSVLGGGALLGTLMVGLLPGALSVFVVRRSLRDDIFFSDAERQARRVGRAASGVGLLSGTASIFWAITSWGAVAGTSGPAISSGLAAIGGLVGGGMTAGVFVSVAWPAVCAALVGYGAYRLALWLMSRRRSSSAVRFA